MVTQLEDLMEDLSTEAKIVLTAVGIASGVVAGYTTVKGLATFIQDIGE